VLNRFANKRGIKILLLPRNKRQEIELRSAWFEQIALGNFLIPEHAEDGLNLIWNSDLVISGGGTMNREAAALGVPVYSIFRGKIVPVDRYLAGQGRLTLLESVEDIKTKIKPLRRKTGGSQRDGKANLGLEAIISNIVSMVEFKTVAASASQSITEDVVPQVITSTNEVRN
jgi:predicted glycosyltransferase